MIKNIIHIVVGLTLFAMAYTLHFGAVDIENEAMEAPYTVDNPVPKGMEHRFFRQPATVAIRKPENQAKLKNARQVEMAAGVFAMASIALILLGTLPIVVPSIQRILGWLCIPGLMRRSHAPDTCDAPDPDAALPAGDATLEAEGDSRSGRSLAIPSQEELGGS